MFVTLPLINKLRFIAFDHLLEHDRGPHSGKSEHRTAVARERPRRFRSGAGLPITV
jgi:hypothetical protein